MENYIVFVWIIFAVFMLVCEALTTQLVSIWFVIGGVAAAVTCIFTDSILIQTIVFVTVSLVALLATRPLVKKFLENKKEPTNSDRLIGRVGIVTEREIKSGANVRISAIEGVKLVVEVM